MKAWVLNNISDIEYKDIEKPQISESEVLVRVRSVGICGSDIPRIYETGAHNMPLVPGHEFAGEVVEVGDPFHSRWVGKRVGVFPLIPCKECRQCKQEKYELCENYNYLGSRCNGAFAEYVAVPFWNVIELPESVAFDEAAMLEPSAVAVHAMRRVDPKPSESVAVIGLGTIGLLLTAVLISNGIKNIYVVGNKKFQKERAMKIGIDEAHYIDAKHENVIEKLKDAGIDACFECVGKNETISQSIDSVRHSGRVCLVGNPYSDITFDKNIYWKILRRQLVVTGSWNSTFTHSEKDDWHYVLNALSDGRLPIKDFVTHRFEMPELETGLKIMRDKTEDYIKIMMVM